MMDEHQLARHIITLDRDIADSVDIIRTTAPEFLVERYKDCNIDCLDIFLAIIDAKIPDLFSDVKSVYIKYLDKDALYAIWASYIVGKPLEVDNESFKDEIEGAKNRWLMSVVMSMDETMDLIEAGGFDN